jgi:hypothetical protein
LAYFDPETIRVAIGAGENGGRTVPHRDIVRELKLLRRWSGERQTTLSSEGSGGVMREAEGQKDIGEDQRDRK